MPLSHAVLALLEEKPDYGYSLKERFETSVGPQWGSLNIGHLYQVLDRLLRDGHATRKFQPQKRRPDKYVYRVTEAGRKELQRWLGVAEIGLPYRDELTLKLLAAERAGTLASVAFEEASARRVAIANLRALQQRSDDMVAGLAIRAAIERHEAETRVLGDVVAGVA